MECPRCGEKAMKKGLTFIKVSPEGFPRVFYCSTCVESIEKTKKANAERAKSVQDSLKQSKFL